MALRLLHLVGEEEGRSCLCALSGFSGSKRGSNSMSEAEFLSRFRREPTGAWACIKPIKIDAPGGPVIIGQGDNFSPGVLFMGLDLAKELDQMAAKQRVASKLAGEAFSTAA